MAFQVQITNFFSQQKNNDNENIILRLFIVRKKLGKE